MTDLVTLTSPDVAGRAHGSVLAIPVGSVEQHGPHLPLGIDTDVACELCRRLADVRPEILVAPPLWYGSSGEHEGFAGTLSIGQAALRSVLVELCRSASRTFRGVVLVCAHGGNADALREACRQLSQEGRQVLGWMSVWRGDAHAGRAETSLALAIDPASVRLERASAGNSTTVAELMPALRSGGVLAVSPNGVLGDPAGASGSEGASMLATLADDLVAAYVHWRSESAK